MWGLNWLRSQRKAMESLEQAQNEAERINRNLSNLIAMMSHEIRTSMNEIIETAQVQLQRKDLPDDYVTALEMIYCSATAIVGNCESYIRQIND